MQYDLPKIVSLPFTSKVRIRKPSELFIAKKNNLTTINKKLCKI